jgi:hypothetical protein
MLIVTRASDVQVNIDTIGISEMLTRKNLNSSKDLAAFVIKYSARRTLPYGAWTCLDGRIVIFNRNYTPIVQQVNGVNAYADKSEWVKDIAKTEYFFDDITDPTRYLRKHLGQGNLSATEAKACKRSLLICLKVLREYMPNEGSSVNDNDTLM